MKVGILAGGVGSRLSEETVVKPKPMVEIGGRPILWHIMQHYYGYGHKDFIIALGYKGEVIKDYFRNYHWNTSDVTLRLGAKPQLRYHNQHDEEDWVVTMIDTGINTMTGGRLKRVLPYIKADTFLLTYGDGVTDSDINASIRFHRQQKRILTLTAVRPPGRFGDIEIKNGAVTAFKEKPEHQASYINGGFFVVDRRISRYLTDDACVLENEPMIRLAAGAAGGNRHKTELMEIFFNQRVVFQVGDSLVENQLVGMRHGMCQRQPLKALPNVGLLQNG